LEKFNGHKFGEGTLKIEYFLSKREMSKKFDAQVSDINKVKSLYLKGILPGISKKVVQELFSKYGTITLVSLSNAKK
jgi:hypothetical protein